MYWYPPRGIVAKVHVNVSFCGGEASDGGNSEIQIVIPTTFIAGDAFSLRRSVRGRLMPELQEADDSFRVFAGDVIIFNH